MGVDTDEDGLDDGCDPCPENADCDADGFCDGSEMYVGTDPLDACPDDPTDDAWPFDINVAGVGAMSATAEAEPLYYIIGGPWIQLDSESPDHMKVAAEARVEFAPLVPNIPVTYPIKLWMDFWVPNVFAHDGSGFHYYWID